MFLVFVLTLISLYFSKKILLFKDIDYKNRFITYLKNMGFKGYLVMILLNCMQVIIAFMPGEVFELISGGVYGAFIGFLLVEIGVFIASILIIWFIKSLKVSENTIRHKFKSKFINEVLDNKDRAKVLIFFLILMPGFPKDIFVYIVPFTKIKTKEFLRLNAIARIPSIISSTIVGSKIIEGKNNIAIIIFVIMALISIIGIIFNKKIFNFILKMNKRQISN